MNFRYHSVEDTGNIIRRRKNSHGRWQMIARFHPDRSDGNDTRQGSGAK